MKRFEKSPPIYSEKKLPLFLFLICFIFAIILGLKSKAQKYQVSVLAGVANYQGNLKPVVFTFQ
jgi:hypothetical protein